MSDVKNTIPTVEQLQALAHPLRWRILRLCREVPRTNQELAERLGVAPPTMLRHVRMLAERGFLSTEPVRRGRNGSTERPYRATGLTLRLSMTEAAGSALQQEVDLAVLTAQRAELVEAGPGATVDSARGILRLGPQSQREMIARIGAVIEEFGRRDESDGEDLSLLWYLVRRPAHDEVPAKHSGAFDAIEALPAAGSRVVVVTGASGGIGEALTRAFADRGDRVLAVARPSSRLEALGALPAVTPVAMDLREAAQTPGPLADLDWVDVLVHCAGMAEVAAVADMTFDDWQETLTVNVAAAAALTRGMLPALRARRGHVVFINASPGMRAVPRWSAYVASKAALRELADSLREEERQHGVRVTTIYPGGVATELLRNVRAQFGRPYDPEDSISPAALASLVSRILDVADDMHITELSVRHTHRPRPRVSPEKRTGRRRSGGH